MIKLRNIVSSEVESAHAFYEKEVANSFFLKSTSKEYYKRLAHDRQLFIAKAAEEIVGVTYYDTREGKTLELGGLVIRDDFKKSGLGSKLLKFNLASLLINELNFDEITCVVHKKNTDPLNLIESLHFTKTGEDVVLNGHDTPEMLPESDGKIYGDLFHMKKPSGIIRLAEWCRDYDNSRDIHKIIPPNNETLFEWSKYLFELSNSCT